MTARLVELAARDPKFAIAGAEINRRTIGAQQKAISTRDRLIARVGEAALAGDIERIRELIAEYEKENR